MKTAYISLGSNMGDRELFILAAIQALGARGIRIARQSSIYSTAPVDVATQNWFLNCVLEIETELMPRQLLKTFQEIENELGRKHTVWFLDATTLFNQIKVADGFRPLGYALWRMGGEDQLVWKLMRHGYGRASAEGLDMLQPGQDVDFDGDGEVLHVENIPTPGRRSIEIDSDTGLISG